MMNRLFFNLLLAVMCLTAIPSHAGVNVERYMGGDGVVPTADAKALLGEVLLHNPSVLDGVTVEVAKLQKRGNVNIAFVYVGRLEDHFDTEIYLLVLDPVWNFVDGALLGYSGDPLLMEILSPQEGIAYQTDDTQTYQTRGDTIKVKRTYTYGPTERGGINYFHDEGSVYNNLLLRKDGKLVTLPIEATAIHTEGDADYLSRTHKIPTKTEIKGNFDGYGMSMMQISQLPVSQAPDMNQLNKDALSVKNARKNTTDIRALRKTVLSGRWIINTGLRNGNDFLTWIAQNPKKEQFTPLLLDAIRQSGMGEAEWLSQKVKTLKDTKARNWWQQWMKENGVTSK
ncbi:MAG: hypothetical protein IJT30_08575 [Muribaculaceae bacterium]|nr:hypothetical protein [Muribaculaceae bacterium]